MHEAASGNEAATARETARAKRMRKAAKGHWWLSVKGSGRDGEEATLQVTLTHGLWLDLQNSLVTAYLEQRSCRGRTRAQREADPKSILGAGLFLDDASVERTMALYEAACATWGHVAEGPRLSPLKLAQLGEAREARTYEEHRAWLREQARLKEAGHA